MIYSLGTAQFSRNYGISNLFGKPSLKEIKKILSVAKQNNVKFLDLAEDYEGVIRLLGKIKINHFKIILKLKIKSSYTKKKIIRNFKNCLKLLNLKKIHAVLIHNVNDFNYKELNNVFEVFKYLKSIGLINKFGISIYSLKEAKKFIKIYNINFLQVPLNVFDQELIKNKNYLYFKNTKTEIHVRSIFLQGLLLMNINTLPKYFKKWKNLFNKFERKKIYYKKNAFELCINFIKINIKKFKSVVIGVNSTKELNEIIFAFKKNKYKIFYKNLSCSDKNLIYPYNWKIKK